MLAFVKAAPGLYVVPVAAVLPALDVPPAAVRPSSELERSVSLSDPVPQALMSSAVSGNNRREAFAETRLIRDMSHHALAGNPRV